MSKTVNEVKELVIEAITKGAGEYKGDFGTALFELDMDGIATDIEILKEREEVLRANIEEKMKDVIDLKEELDTTIEELRTTSQELARFKND